MKKTNKLLLFFLFLPALFSLSASRGPAAPPVCTVVTQVDVVYAHPEITVLRTYTQPQKIASILNYLRLLQYRGKPQIDPETISDDRYRITLHYSDGCRRVYRQYAYRYLSKNFRPWEKVDSSQAQLLYPLLQLLPADL